MQWGRPLWSDLVTKSLPVSAATDSSSLTLPHHSTLTYTQFLATSIYFVFLDFVFCILGILCHFVFWYSVFCLLRTWTPKKKTLKLYKNLSLSNTWIYRILRSWSSSKMLHSCLFPSLILFFVCVFVCLFPSLIPLFVAPLLGCVGKAKSVLSKCCHPWDSQEMTDEPGWFPKHPEEMFKHLQNYFDNNSRIQNNPNKDITQLWITSHVSYTLNTPEHWTKKSDQSILRQR